MAGSALGPPLGFASSDALVPYGLTVAGLALIVTGLVDHEGLVRILGAATEDADDERLTRDWTRWPSTVWSTSPPGWASSAS